MSFVKIIVFFGLFNKQKFIRTLAKIEYGNAVFCEKLERQALTENRYELAKLLRKHAQEEEKHGRMLSSIADGSDRIHRVGTGRWVKILRGQQNIVKKFIEPLHKPKTIQWESKTYPGEQLTGVLESFDGLSYRFACSRLLWRNCAAFDYPWEDRLAFMYVLEEEVASLYLELMSVKDGKISSIASDMTEDEFNHANYLKMALCRFVPFPEELLNKWRNRVKWAKLGLIVDGIIFYLKKPSL